MTKTEFLLRLREMLSELPQEDAAERLVFYGEMIDDRMEDGLTEDEAVSGIGQPEEIAQQILAETPVRRTERERESIRNSFPQYSSETVAIDGIFRDIDIDSRTEDLTILPAEDGVCKAVFYGSDRQKHEVSVEGKTLFIRITEEGKWYDRIAFFSSQKTGIELYLTEPQYSSLRIKGSTGDIEVTEQLSFEDIDIASGTGDVICRASVSGKISVRTGTGDVTLEDMSAGAVSIVTASGDTDMRSAETTGDIKIKSASGDICMEEVSCRNVDITTASGDLDLAGVRAEEEMEIGSISGDTSLRRCDASALSIKSSSGGISGTLLSEKKFDAKSRNGDVKVPISTDGGSCMIRTISGDIRMRVKN